MYGPIINSLSNIYTTCDQYHGDCEGSAEDYWGEFHGYYSSEKNPTNWLHIIINNGTGGGHNTCNSDNSTSWYDLLHFAKGSLGINKVWLYAYGTGAGENDIINFCYSAWQTGWLLRQEKQVETLWYCDTDNPSPCAGCSWPNVGTWYVFESFYTGQVQYANY